MQYYIIILFLILLISLFVNNDKKNLSNKKIIVSDSKNGLLIIHNFFSQKDFNKILQSVSNTQTKYDDRISSRSTKCLSFDKYKKLYDLIYKNSDFIKISKKMMINIPQYPDYPIEYRKYETGSEGMDWHSDVPMFSTQSMECVLTLKNTSDSHFYWKDNDIIKKISTKPNTLVIVLSNSVKHMVSKLNFGERFILKFVHHQKDSDHTQSFYYHRQKCPK